MSAPKKITRISNITFGYADSEDRLWARLILNDQTETTLWLTRALCQAGSNAIARLLEKNAGLESSNTLDPEAQAKQVRMEYFEAKTTTWSPTPAAPDNQSQTVLASSGKLCHTLQITPGDTWQLSFMPSGKETFTMLLKRNQLFKILIALLMQAHKANWHLQTEVDWIDL